MDKIYFSKLFISNLLDACTNNFPGYTRGVVVTKDKDDCPSNFYTFDKNERLSNDNIIKIYESFGPYYKNHKGFVANPIEMVQIEKNISKNCESICGIFHVHIDFPACPTRLDVEMFYQSVGCPDKIWYLIISYLDPEKIDVRAFRFENKLLREIKIVYEDN